MAEVGKYPANYGRIEDGWRLVGYQHPLAGFHFGNVIALFQNKDAYQTAIINEKDLLAMITCEILIETVPGSAFVDVFIKVGRGE